MAVPSRHNSLGNADSNPSLHEVYPPALTEYEVARERRKKELHDHVELAFKSRGIELDTRVSAGFRGESPAMAAQVVRNSGKRRKCKRSVFPKDSEALPVRTVRQSE
jgi:hypothetical protein